MSDAVTDGHIGRRLRQARTGCGLSQAALADRLGVSFQQVQKYEKGINRLSASMLYRIAALLAVPVNFFFEQRELEAYPRFDAPGWDRAEASLDEAFARRETLVLLRHYYALDAYRRGYLKTLIATLAESQALGLADAQDGSLEQAGGLRDPSAE